MNLIFNFLFFSLFFMSMGCSGGTPEVSRINELKQSLEDAGCSDEIKDSYINAIEQFRGKASDIESKINGLIRFVEKNGC